MSKGYNVVFEYTAAAGAYEGVRTWSSFMDHDAFVRFPKRDLERVLAEGVTEDAAITLVQDTPISAYVGVALAESKGADGALDRELLSMELGTKLYAIMSARGLSLSERLVDNLIRFTCASRDSRRMYEDPAAMKRVQERLATLIGVGISIAQQ